MAESALMTSEADFEVTCGRNGLQDLDKAAAEWDYLCRTGPDDLPFYRPEWTRAYVRAFAPAARLLLFSARKAGRLSAILPLIEDRVSLKGVSFRILRAPTNVHVPAFSVVRSPGEEGAAAVKAIWAHLIQEKWDYMEFPSVREGSSISILMDAARQAGYPVAGTPFPPSPFMMVPKRREEVDRLPPSSSLRKRLRQISRDVPLNLRRSGEAHTPFIDEFYNLEASGWKGQQGTAIICDAGTRLFYDEICAAAAAAGYLAVYLLDSGGDLLAGHLGLEYRGRYFTPKAAYNEQRKDLGPGHLIVHSVLRDLMDRDVFEYDRTGPPADYKMQWCRETHPMANYIIYRRNMRGRGLHMLLFQIKPIVKQLVRRSSPPDTSTAE
jgi:CelD/BcsL family acetyltransferase involved in cellulose biosynthesis